MKRYCLALDLVDDEELIREYEAYHRQVWPEIKESIVTSGIEDMEFIDLPTGFLWSWMYRTISISQKRRRLI